MLAKAGNPFYERAIDTKKSLYGEVFCYALFLFAAYYLFTYGSWQ